MYDQYLKINKSFKSSVNLQYDLNNEEKIKQYIPTTDLCDVIKKYLLSIIYNYGDKSTLLAGPYGKGKSYLMLIITFLLSKNKNKDVLKELVTKISLIDEELAHLILDMDKKKIDFLPVVINDNESDDLNQSFMLGLKMALEKNNLKDSIPESTFSECLAQIAIWENDKGLDLLNECERRYKTNLQDLKNGLKLYKKDAYKKFLSLFECINHGYKFNSLIGNDISKIYLSVAKELTHHGYKGMFVIFDEFGVFLENKTIDFASRINKIQNFAEMCNSSSIDSQIRFCCITHKDIALYKHDLNLSDDFEKIAGRFTQIRFDRSLEENYQLICNAIVKKEGYAQKSKEIYINNFVSRLKKSGIISSDKQVDYIIANGFPFNPVSLYALTRVSEKIAQNERTLFTYISDSDLYTFKYFITNESTGLLNIDDIFNYFDNIIKNNDLYKSIYFKVDALSRIDLKTDHHKIFKCIAMMKIINDDVRFNPTIGNISLALFKDESEIERTIEELISEKLLTKNINDNSIDFDIIADSEINELINKALISSVGSEPLSVLLSKFDKNRYTISNKYNYEFAMTRYFYTIYLECSKFKQLSKLSSLFSGIEADGLIVDLIDDSGITINEIQQILLADDTTWATRIIVRLHTSPFNNWALNKLKSYFAIRELLDNKKGISESALETLKTSQESLQEELNAYLLEYHLDGININKHDYKQRDLITNIYNSLNASFSQTIVFNNEQVNKNTISTATTKARNKVIDGILGLGSMDFGKTSAEGTIFASFEQSLQKKQNIIGKIKRMIVNSKKDTDASKLINYLIACPYGLRKGVIPLFIARAISMLSIKKKDRVETVLLYNGSMQIVLNAANLTKLMNDPSRYHFCYQEINKQRIKFLASIAQLFDIKQSPSFADDIENIVREVRSYVSNLEPIIIKSDDKNNLLNLSKKALLFKNMFLRQNINSFDLLFDDLNTFGATEEDRIIMIKSICKEYKQTIVYFYSMNISKVKELFGSSNETIKTEYGAWKINHPWLQSLVLDEDIKKIYKAFEGMKYNDNESIDNLSYAILNCSLKDWNLEKEALFYNKLSSFIEFASEDDMANSLKKSDVSAEISFDNMNRISSTLYSNLQDVLDDYGSSLTNAEKTIVLKKLIKDIIE
ncbi:MAG: hypothetical protein WC201_01780 [Bacilli bacterium]